MSVRKALDAVAEELPKAREFVERRRVELGQLEPLDDGGED